MSTEQDPLDRQRAKLDCTRLPAARPLRGWIRLATSGLGSLPTMTHPDPVDHPDVPRHRALAYLTLLVPLGMIVGMIALLPRWATRSPVYQAAEAVGGAGAAQLAVLVVFVALFGFILWELVRGGPAAFGRLIHQMAVHEEVWFRAGCEDWSWWQRVRSCVQFGFAHVINLIVAIVTLGALCVVGGIFMAVYLAEYRRSGSTERATLAAARFHADYNVAAFTLALLVLGLLTVSMVASLLAYSSV